MFPNFYSILFGVIGILIASFLIDRLLDRVFNLRKRNFDKRIYLDKSITGTNVSYARGGQFVGYTGSIPIEQYRSILVKYFSER